MEQRKMDNGMPHNMMKLPLKKLEEQVMVITGASSGIGLVTARMAAKKGAKLVLAARNETALSQLCEELKSGGHDCIYVVADVAKEKDVTKIAEAAVQTFGGFDTWVNNASVAIYGHATDIPVEDMRQLFDINFWGMVYGSRTAVQHFKEKGSPGALINIGSVAGNRSFPIQSVYSSSKFAVHSFTDGLRMELEKEHAPVSVTQIHPAKVDTPYTDHATSYIDKYPSHGGMVYAPESVAEAVLYAAEHPVRDIYVGTQAKFFSIVGRVFPRMTDMYMETIFYPSNYDESRTAKAPEEGNLYHPGAGLMERGSNYGWKRTQSAMVKVKTNPALKTAVSVGAGLLLIRMLRKK